MDRKVWRAAIHGVAKSWTRLSDWTELNWTEWTLNIVVNISGILAYSNDRDPSITLPCGTTMPGARLRTDLYYHLHPNSTEAGSGSLIFQLCNVAKTKRFLFLTQWDRWQSNFSSRRVSWKPGSELSGVRERSGKLTIHTNLAFMLHLNRRIACLRKRRLNRMQKSHDIMFKMSWIQPKILHYNDNQKNDNLNQRR